MLEQVFPGDSELAGRMRAFDWSRTDLGPPHQWPQSLKTAVRIMLASRQPIWIGWGKDLTYLYNDPYKSIIGDKHPRMLGQPTAVVWQEIWGDIEPLLAKAMRGGEGTYVESQLLIMERSGYPEETYYTFSYTPIPDDRGIAGGIICANTDDTQRVIDERQLALLRELAARTSDVRNWQEVCERIARALATNRRDLPFALIYLVDPAGRGVSLAGASGIDRGHPAAPPSVPLDAPSPWPFAEVLQTRAPRLVTDLGSLFANLPRGPWPRPPTRAVALPVAASGEKGRAGVLIVGLNPFRLFNEDYRAFLSLAALQISAAVGSADAYEKEKRQAAALAELDRAKTAFFSNVSHEFRTPLTLMLGPVEELLARSYTELSPAAKGQLEVVSRNGLRLLRLVNTLLDFSRIEAGRVRAVFQPTDLAAFTAELASVFRAACERAGLRLVVDCPELSEPAFVDRDMWEKVVLNLLSNAFKFTFEGEIAVTLRQVGKTAELRVTDTGTGIPAEEMGRLFERFHRVQNARGRTHEGSGIGLALVQELVKLHGGSVTARSVVGQGTTFVVAVPLGSAHLPPDQIGEGRTPAAMRTGAGPYVEEALRWLPDKDQGADDLGSELPSHYEALPVPALRAEPDPDDDRPRILVADDNADMRQYIARLLAEHYRTQVVADGEAALAAARARPPDLVLTDVMMPRLDGFGLLRELRADPATANLPVIMLSARAGEESRVEGMEAGADDYLVKPFGARELLARVGAHLQLARLRRESERAVRESRELLRVTLASIGDAVITTDTEGRITYLNDVAESLTGWKNDEAAGQTLGAVFRVVNEQTRRPVADPATRALREGVVVGLANHSVLINRDGTERPIDDSAAPIKDEQGHVVGCVLTFRDVAERRQSEKRIHDLMIELRAADRRKDEFLATLAHELRNPLAPLSNMLAVMKHADGKADLIEQARGTMERQLGSLVRLVDDLLDVSRITRNKLELRKERVELAAVIRQAVETCRPLAEGFKHEVTVTLPPEPISLHADPVRLAQVFSNLFNNACKYTEPKGHVWLTAERQGSDAVVTVKDTGLGIPPDKLTSIFDMFAQVDGTLGRSQGGLGIGLTLVKRLVEMHGGTVTAHSLGPGRGSEFVVRLPLLVKEPQAPTPGPTAEATQTTGRRILVVDDNRDSAASLAMLLKMAGNEARTAHDGLEAVEVAGRFRPDVVLLDIGLPNVNGYDACRRIRQEPWGKDMLLVALTGWGQDEDRRKSHEAGFDRHLVKPVDYAALMKLLAESQAMKA